MEMTAIHMFNCKNDEDDYALMVERAGKHPELINSLQPESIIFSDKTYALHEAARLSHLNCVRFLLRSGASPDAYDCRLYTAMLHALSSRKNEEQRCEIVSSLLEHGASLHYLHVRRNRTRYIEQAISMKLNLVLKNLLERGSLTADFVPTCTGELQCRTNFDPPICIAISTKNLHALESLLFHGAPVRFFDFHNNIVSLPHRMIEVFFKDHQLKAALHLYYEYGGNMWTTFHGQNAAQAVAMVENGYYFNVKLTQVETLLKTIMGTPRSLQSLCRLTIKKSIGRNYWRQVEFLPLPTQIISYLYFSDCQPSPLRRVSFFEFAMDMEEQWVSQMS